MSPKKIDAGAVPPAINPPKLNNKPAEKFFTFSLRHWRQTEYFGLGKVDVGWYDSLLSRLCDLSKEKVSRFMDDRGFQDGIRYHVVDWDHRNVPLRRQDLTWLPPGILNNADEFPLYQFHISKAMGRVHGFWDSEDCFNIVLLDPLHNLQPSGEVGYKIQATTISSCEFSSLQTSLEAACAKPCKDTGCELAAAVQGLPNLKTDRCVIIASVSLDVASHLQALRKKKAVSISDIVEYGITFME